MPPSQRNTSVAASRWKKATLSIVRTVRHPFTRSAWKRTLHNGSAGERRAIVRGGNSFTARLKPCPDTCMVDGCGVAVQADVGVRRWCQEENQEPKIAGGFMRAPLRCARALRRKEGSLFCGVAARLKPCPDTCMAGGYGMAVRADVRRRYCHGGFMRASRCCASEPCGIRTAAPFAHAQLFNELQLKFGTSKKVSTSATSVRA
jgi:hypothetical protein